MMYDAIMIGFGKGAKTLAAHLATQGKSVALIEKSKKMYGGTCINVGCIPSKSLVRSAGISAGHLGNDFQWKSQWYQKAIEEKHRVTTMLRQKNYEKLNQNSNITVYDGIGRFVSPTEVEVDYGDEKEVLSATHIFINTGATSVIPKIKGIEGNSTVYYSDSLMTLEVLPERLTIIGGGYIGLEFASMYSNFGSKVTILQDGDAFIPREDADIAEAIRGLLEKQGVTFRLGAAIEEVKQDGTVAYTWEGSHYEDLSDAVLAATGRRANTDDLNLKAASVEMTPRGAVQVDEYLRTTQPGIWAMGDVAGGLQFTYVSLDDYRIVASQLDQTRDYSTKMRQNVPYSVFMDTPFSRVGMNEREAGKAGYDVKIVKLPAAAIPKAQVLKKTDGILKAVIDRSSNRILGAMFLCEESYEMINIVKLAMDMGADYTVLRDQIFTHPTMSESLNDLFAL